MAGMERTEAEPIRHSASDNACFQAIFRVLLVAGLLGLGLYILAGFLRALVWAVVLAVALWPLFARARRRLPPGRHNLLWPAVFTGLVALVLLLPVVALAVEAAREAHDLLAYAREAERNGIPVPAFVAHLPYGAEAVSAWWNAHLAHAGLAHELSERLNTASNRDLTRSLGAGLVHRVVLFGFCLLALFFLFREGDTVIAQGLRASHRLFGPRGERVARQMAASVHGTVDGLVLVGLGEGVLLGIVYALTGVPHPVLFGALTAVAAMIPFGAPLAFGLAAALLLAGGAVVPAVIVVAAGFVVTFVADHFVRPALIGGTTRLPFLWVLLGILGGVETFGLLGLFVGPAVMAALILLWREFTDGAEAVGDPGGQSPPVTEDVGVAVQGRDLPAAGGAPDRPGSPAR
ncbi:putative PurR-regulated permease PerM [Methylobacterium sp. B4]|nr:putative PurR-regulated permease PerM [Methylobacterium sp. B4]